MTAKWTPSRIVSIATLVACLAAMILSIGS